MQFQVPQFIEVEDKIFGPLTLKQFIYLIGGGGAGLLIYVLVHPLFLALIVMTPFVIFALALAFYKINNQPFINVVESATNYFFTTKLYIWRKEDKVPTGKEDTSSSAVEGLILPKMSNSKLKDMTWSLGTKQEANPVTHDGKTE